MNIEDTFKASASSIYETFMCHNGNCGFRIPEYQRNYEWSKKNIERLFDDVFNGLLSFKNDKSTLTFLGTILLVNDDNDKENTFNGQSRSVVDGQQRLITLCLIICTIQNQLCGVLFELNNVLSDCRESQEWVTEEIDLLLDQLFSCVMGDTNRRGNRTSYDYYPRIVRQNTDFRASNDKDAKYRSILADYIFNFGNFIRGDLSETRKPYEFPYTVENDGNLESFRRNVTAISELVTSLRKGRVLDDSLANVRVILETDDYLDLFQKMDDVEDRSNIIDALIDHDTEYVGEAIRLIVFGNYILNRVALTRVEAQEEDNAFDIFESLNTTGVPLTAIETFKPRVIKFEDNQEGRYIDSPSDHSLQRVEKYLAIFDKNSDRDSESKEIVVSFALYVSGKKIGKHLSEQRKHLRLSYEKLGNDLIHRRRFVKAFSDLVEYKDACWERSNIPSLLMGENDKDLVQFCLGVIRDMNTSLTIPILCRFFHCYKETNNPQVFIDAVKALTAFLIIRRGATGGTANIDADFRSIMSKGAKNGTNPAGLCLGTGFSNDVPDIEGFKSMLRSYLESANLAISDEEAWCRLVASHPLKKQSTPLCRAMLLIASHNAEIDRERPGMITKVLENQRLCYMDWPSWGERKEFETVEHIAPNTFRHGWEVDIYEHPSIRDTLGNLTLLPEKENASLSNRPWLTKKLYYNAFNASDDKELDGVFEKAKEEGLDFGDKIEKYLRSRRERLPFIESICKVGDWSRSVIEERSKNLASLVWREISDWIGM